MSHQPKKSTGLPTLEDVARRADVSTATVSRCLNEPDLVVEKTRVRVMAAVRELGYAPNFGAQSLATRRTNTIGAIIPTMANAIFATGLQSFQEELGRRGITLLVASSSYSEGVEEEQIRTLIARGADGLLLIGYDRNAAIYDFLDRRGVPYLVTWAYDITQKSLSIGFDNRAAARALARDVIALGHRDIAVISAWQDGNDRARERVLGIRDAASEAGFDADATSVVETVYSLESGGEAFRQLIASPKQPTVVMCGNDVLAVGALLAAQDMGLNVPGDVSITGFDDIEIAMITRPRLTTVHVPHQKMGQQAAEMLAAMLNGERPAASVELATEIIHRGSLAAPRDS